MNDRIKVVTFNIRVACAESNPDNNWIARLPRIIARLRKWKPDLIGFQEATLAQYDDLAAALSGYGSTFTARDGGEGEGTPVFYLKEKFTVLDSGGVYLNEHPSLPGIGWDAAYPRVCSFVRLALVRSGKTLAYYNTHLDNKGALAQKNGLYEIEKLIRTERGCGVILSGDFNVGEDSEVYRLSASVLNDVKYCAACCVKGGTYHGYGAIPFSENVSPIDYIFISRDFKAVSYSVDAYEGDWASDHFAVIAELEL